MKRPGDASHELFQMSLDLHRPLAMAERNGAVAALDILAQNGHDTVITGNGSGPVAERPAFDRLELLSWRMIDEEQDNFANAICADNREAAVEAVDRASCFLDLLAELRAVPADDHV